MLDSALLFWRAELRVQRLVSRRPAVAAAQVALALSIMVLLAVQVRALVMGGGPATTNVAVLSVAGVLLVFANVVVTGREASATVAHLWAWARPRPLTDRQVHALIVLVGLFRAALFTVTIVGAVAVGAILGAPTPGRVVEIAVAAVLLPLGPIAVGLWFSARRAEAVPSGLLTGPLGLVVVASAFALPAPAGWLSPVVAALAAPGNALLGELPASQATILVSVWLGATVWFLDRLKTDASQVDAARRYPRAALLAAQGPGRLVWDLTTHRLRLTDAVEAGALTLLLAVAAAATRVTVTPTAGSVAAGHAVAAADLVVLGTGAAVLGHQQLTSACTLPAEALTWLRSTVLPMRRLVLGRHALATAGATGTAALFALALLALRPVTGPLPGALWVALLLTGWSLTGWLATAQATRGWARALSYYVVGQVVAVRAVAVGVLVVLDAPPPAIVVAAAVDVLVAAAGHALAARSLEGAS